MPAGSTSGQHRHAVADSGRSANHAGHRHEQGHGHSHQPTTLRSLLVVLGVTSVVFVGEIIAGIFSGSLALLADAAHMLFDSAGLILALCAMFIGRKHPSGQATFGYRRVEVLAAALNAAAVFVVTIWIAMSAIARIGSQPEIETGWMLIVAIIGLVANVTSALVLVRRQHESLNLRGAYLHVLSDAVGSVAVIIAGVIIRTTGWMYADTIASVIIALLIIPRSWQLLTQSVGVLLEQAPKHSDPEAVRAALAAIPGVTAVHDLHIWSTDGTNSIVTAHLVVDTAAASNARCTVLDQAHDVVCAMGAGHTTFQLEPAGHVSHEFEIHR
ncbi:cation diffusion facilitator family transporter [Corynebacterium choanae]|uniref:cation diffusion facilitator family transporter n=1 Tax=Corynebacterium choanae TaxID=1862358 RepID=UPI00360AD2BB